MNQSIAMKSNTLNTLMSENSLWIFAYGSLLWKPCFHYERQIVGHVKGFKRRFFQGNTNLRGTKAQPGRVAILMPDKEEVTWGVAFEVRGKQHVQHAIDHLYQRENKCGGYYGMQLPFHPCRPAHTSPSKTTMTTTTSGNTSSGEDDSDSASDSESDADLASDSDLDFASDSHLGLVSDSDLDPTSNSDPTLLTVLTFTATPESSLYMGPADFSTMAMQVVAAEGKAGPNSEYVLRTAEYVRHHIPEDTDVHLFELERAVRERLLTVHSGIGRDVPVPLPALTVA